MIRYRLVCDRAHDFEAWFASSVEFDEQVARDLVQCASCGSTKVERALMAPAVRTSKRPRTAGDPPATSASSESPAPASPGSAVSAAVPPSRAAGSPNVAKLDATQKAFLDTMRKVREHVLKNGIDVGRAFPEQARKIHYGEAEQRGIYGEATAKEASELIEEGIAVMPLPQLPEDHN